MAKELKKPFSLIVEPSLKDAFVETCKGMDTTASREVRRFMREFVRKNGQKKLI